MNIFVGNLSFEAKEIDVERVFRSFGVVTSVAIVMEKKGKKSRGFGFVEMPDEHEALAAIAQLQGKNILDRPINVMPALSKEPKKPAVKKAKFLEEVSAEQQKESSSEGIRSDSRKNFSFKRTGKYKEGRRSLSYLKKRVSSGEVVPESTGRRYKSNPMRWRKKPRWAAASSSRLEGEQTKPWQRGEAKPWQRPQTESNPWKKPGVRSNSWKKPEGEARPGQRSEGGVKPWQKSRREARPWRKTESAESRPWKKPEGEAKPWQKDAGKSRPWVKPEGGQVRRHRKPEGTGFRPWKKRVSKPGAWRKKRE